MNEEINPGPASENAAQSAGTGLAGAFEELIQARLAGIPRAGRPEPERARTEDADGRCPKPGDWAALLSDEALPANAAKVRALLDHAAGCAVCAERLRVFAADVSPEESAVLAGLDYSSAGGQRKLAARLAGTPVHSGARRPPRLYLWTGVGLAASLLIGVGLFSWWRMANTPENLLAEAYAHERIFDVRMPGAGFAEVTPRRHLRGGASGSVSGANGAAGREPARLLDARARIEQHLVAAPEDAHWLQLEARSDILEEKFDQAIDILDRLVAGGPVSESLLLDDASAYFERGEATGNENDRATALDLLQRADELAPGDPVVLFNEALALEDRGQAMNAVETWNRYLRFERDPRWLAEGRRRLDALEKRLNQLKTHPSQPPTN
jgi:tetratricopeptide (TPR) repeat protein